MATFRIVNAQNTLYIDNGGRPVNGYQIRVELNGFNETHEINVPSLEPEVVRQAVERLLAQREALANLGGE